MMAKRITLLKGAASEKIFAEENRIIRHLNNGGDAKLFYASTVEEAFTEVETKSGYGLLCRFHDLLGEAHIRVELL